MPCRVGITTDLARRKKEWLREHTGLTEWKIIAVYSNKSAAQDRENREAEKLGCSSSPGGYGAENTTWYVYHFRY